MSLAPSAADSREETLPSPWLLGAGLLPAAYLLLASHSWLIPSSARAYDEQRILEIGMFGLVVLLLAAIPPVRFAWMETWRELSSSTRSAMTVVLVLGIVSAVRAPLAFAASREVGIFVLATVATVLVAAARRTGRDASDRLLLVVIVAAVLLFTVINAVAIATGFNPVEVSVTSGRDLHGFSNPRFFGQYATWLFPLVAAAPLVLDDGRRATRVVLLLTAAGWWALLLESGGRGSVLASVFAPIVAAALVGAKARRWLAWTAAAASVGTALWFSITRVAGFLGGTTDSPLGASVGAAVARGVTDTEYRPRFWAEALDMVRGEPLLGVGPEHYAFFQTHAGATHPHNSVLQVASEWGLPAALIVLSLAAVAMVSWVRMVRGGPTLVASTEIAALISGLTASLVAGAALSLVDGVIVTPMSQICLVLVAGWMLGIHLDRRGARRKVQDRRRGWTVSVVAAGALVALLYGATPYILRPWATMYEEMLEHDLRMFLPRFWIQGRTDLPPEPVSTSL